MVAGAMRAEVSRSRTRKVRVDGRWDGTGRPGGGARTLHCFALAAAFLWAGVSFAAPTELKIATTAPDGSAWMTVLRQGAADVEAATAGRVRIKFFPSGVRGDDRQVLRRIRVGQLDGGIVQTGVVGRLFSDIQIYNLPMVFRDLAEVDFVREIVDPMLIASAVDAGFVCFGIAELGMSYPMSTKEAHTLVEARRLKVWSPQGDLPASRTLSAFGISPIPLPVAEVLTGLQTDLIDTVAVPPVVVFPLLWHTKLKYVVDLPIMYIYSLAVVTRSSLASVAEADIASLKRIMAEAVAEVDRRNRADHAEAWQALKTQGLRILRLSDEEVAEWRRTARQARQAWVDEGFVSKRMHATLANLLAEARSAPGFEQTSSRPSPTGGHGALP